MKVSAGAWGLTWAGFRGGIEGDGTCSPTADWPGWQAIRHAFTFGDSYTTTGFQHRQPSFPSPSVPLGNPGYPGWTSSNGPNWIDLLTVKHNASVLLTYNLAVGGATVDSDLDPSFDDDIPSVKVQIREHFMPTYAAPPSKYGQEGGDATPLIPTPDWEPGSSLFAVWIGINDINNSYRRGGPEFVGPLYRAVVDVYGALLRDLHGAGGARNFVLLTVPPIDRSPWTRIGGDEAMRVQKAAVELFNALVRRMARVFVTDVAGENGGANVWVYDAHETFGKVMDDPAVFPETARYRDVEGYCEAYASGTPTPDTYYPECGIPADEYMWSDIFHPTSPIHDAVARQIAQDLQAGRPNVCPRGDLLSYYWDRLVLRYGGVGGSV